MEGIEPSGVVVVALNDDAYKLCYRNVAPVSLAIVAHALLKQLITDHADAHEGDCLAIAAVRRARRELEASFRELEKMMDSDAQDDAAAAAN